MDVKDVVALETERFGTIIGEVIELNDEWVKLKLHTTIEGNNTVWNVGDEKCFRLSLISSIAILNKKYEYLLFIENTTNFGKGFRVLDTQEAAKILKMFQDDDKSKVNLELEMEEVYHNLTIKWRVMYNGWYFTLLDLNEENRKPFVLSDYKNRY